MRAAAALSLVLMVGTGCWRTEYIHLYPPASPTDVSETSPVRGGRRWQSFFVFGWAPGERLIDAAGQCGSAQNIQSLRTRRTFLQSLVGGATYSIYAPYDGAVWCWVRLDED